METEESSSGLAAPIQDFPVGAPAALSAERVSLEELVHHRWSVDEETQLEEVQKAFRDRRVEFLATVRNDRVTGICSQVRLGALLGSRFGFALYSTSPARLIQVEHPLIFPVGTPIRQVLDQALARHADDFHKDVVLVDADRRLLGLIPIDALAGLQTRLVGEQLAELQRQHETLRRQNVELFQANHALRQVQGLYRGLFESNALGVALLDARGGGIQAHNRRLTELLNLGEGPLELASLDGWMTERDRAQFRALLAAHEGTRDDAAPTVCEFVLQVPGRGSRLFRFTTGWIRETGQVCTCIDDITNQRALERNSSRQEKQRMLDTLVGGIAHELNNKLTPVLGYAESFARSTDPQIKGPGALILRSSREAARIIRQLLQFSQPDSGHARRIDLGSTVEEALLMLKFQIREGRCSLSFNRPVEAVVVMADPAHVKQVVMNIVLNAVQAMEEIPEPRLGIAVGCGANGAFVAVSDNGAGIPREIINRIFDPFFTTKGPDRGSGLGLSICLSIARQYGGDIAVDSEPGGGSTFTFALPVEDGPVENDSQGGGPESAPSRMRPNRVLVADDEPVVRLLLQEMLRANFNSEVDLAANGAEALLLADRSHYDLVISDIRMPVLEGTEFYRRLRELRPDLARRFVFITGFPGEQALQDEINAWCVPVLAKPFSVGRLIEVCQPMLASRDAKAVSA